MDISFAFGSFVVLMAAWAIAARRRERLRPVPERHGAQAGKAGFLRRLAS
jgi:hypothetical protein